MPRFTTFDGIELAYTDEGSQSAEPVVLLHGFAADGDGNWRAPGVIGALLDARRRVVTLDARGHGRSDKPHDPAAYGNDAMVRDVQALLDHLGIAGERSIDVAGYSMGAMITARLLPVEPRVRSAILGGVGGGIARSGMPADRAAAIADALLADDPATIANPVAKAFRQFADSTGADRHALAAIQRSPRYTTEPDLGSIKVPVLVLVGDNDVLVGPPDELAALIPGARVEIVSGDHLSAVNDPEFRRRITAFFAEAG